jgi:hypothetical protein
MVAETVPPDVPLPSLPNVLLPQNSVRPPPEIWQKCVAVVACPRKS